VPGVRHVQAKEIGPGIHQAPDGFLRLRGRPERGQYSRLPSAFHGGKLLKPWSIGEVIQNWLINKCSLIDGGFLTSFDRGNFWCMATKEDKYEDNVAGKYYCDTECIDCDLCRETAPDNYKRNEDGGYSFVYKQPENEEEEALCAEAMDGCPVEAIGSDGADD
jgi:ferredoxin